MQVKGGHGQLKCVQSRREVLVGVGAVSSTEGNAYSVSPTRRSRLIKALLFSFWRLFSLLLHAAISWILCRKGTPQYHLDK